MKSIIAAFGILFSAACFGQTMAPMTPGIDMLRTPTIAGCARCGAPIAPSGLFCTNGHALGLANSSHATVMPGVVTHLRVGDAVLTKKSVLALVDTLERYRDNTIPAFRAAFADNVRNAKSTPHSADLIRLYDLLTRMTEEDLEKKIATINAQITELKKLADALAPEATK